MKPFSIISFLFVALVISSCNNNVVFSENVAMPGSWALNDTVKINLPELDSIAKYDLLLSVRNTNNYPFNNLFLIVDMEFPRGKHITDTLEYRMAYPDGSWMGEGLGSVKENLLWYKKGVRFFEPGNYKLSIVHAVRNNGNVNGVERLDGIIDVGIRVEPHNTD